MLFLDLETRSPVPIQWGVYRYAEQAEIICGAYAFDDGLVRYWLGEDFPDELLEYQGDIVAANAEFEATILEHTGWEIAPERWICSAVHAAGHGLPRSLDGACRALGLPQQKQPDGAQLIRDCCIPPYDESPDKLAKLTKYCMQDVRAMRNLYQCMREPLPCERADFLRTLQINDAGIPVDVALIEATIPYAEQEGEHLRAEIEWRSKGELTKKSGIRVTQWVYRHLPEDLKPIMERGDKVTLDKATRTELLEQRLDKNLYRLIECVDLASRSSVSKYQTMLNRAEQGEVRGCYLMNGGSTGRFSSAGLQMHNLPRKTPENPERVREQIMLGQKLENPMKTLSHMLRPTVCDLDIGLTWSDWSAIEGRVLPWLAKSPEAERKLDLYRKALDVYVETAKGIFPGETIDSEKRQVGKVAELSLGYAGGAGALHAMARNYGVEFTDREAETIKDRWRTSNSWAVRFWGQLDDAAHAAYREPGETVTVGRVSYTFVPEYLGGSLICVLPSGRPLCYPRCERNLEEAPWSTEDDPQHIWVLSAIKGNLKPKVGEPWPRHRLWKGLLAENITQAVAADILRHCLREGKDLPIIGHTHDEIILRGQSQGAELQQLMQTPPDWATGLPLKAEVKQSLRYGK